MKPLQKKLKKFFENFYLVLVLVFLYAPIAVMMVLSFNRSKSRSHWGGFTLRSVSYTHLDVYKRQPLSICPPASIPCQSWFTRKNFRTGNRP